MFIGTRGGSKYLIFVFIKSGIFTIDFTITSISNTMVVKYFKDKFQYFSKSILKFKFFQLCLLLLHLQKLYKIFFKNLIT